MFERFTDRARRVLVLAQEEARTLGHDFIGTEHLLLGLIEEQDGIAAEVLLGLGVSAGKARERVRQTVGLSGHSGAGSPPFTPRVKKVLALSLREALALGGDEIGTEHLLLGLLSEGEGVGSQVLVSLGADLSRVREEVLGLLAERQREASRSVGTRPGRTGAGRLRQSSTATSRLVPSGVPARRAECSFCGRDLWEVGRHVSAGPVAICGACLSLAQDVFEHADAEPGGEVVFPPRIFGDPPDDRAVGEILAAVRTLLQEPPVRPDEFARVVEDGEHLVDALAEARRRHPVLPRGARVERIRFLDEDTAEFGFVILLGGLGAGIAFEGWAVRRDGTWLVTRNTVLGVLRRAGVSPPPLPPTE